MAYFFVFLIAGSSSETPHEIKWNSIEKLVRLGILQLESKLDAANEETTPETLTLNIRRLQKAQNDFHHIIVIATRLLNCSYSSFCQIFQKPPEVKEFFHFLTFFICSEGRLFPH